VAHEIGEHLAHRVFQRLAVDPRDTPSGTREQVANALASRLLLTGTEVLPAVPLLLRRRAPTPPSIREA